MTTLLLVEDNESLRNMLAMRLARAGYHIAQAGDGNEALELFDRMNVDIMVLDIMMPGMDGLTLAVELREAGYTLPILITTAKETLEDKRKGFGAGADDYMVKPLDVDEMLLRIEALLRRAQISCGSQLVIGDTCLDQDSLTTSCGGKITVLPQKEFYVLQALLSYPGKIFTRQALMDEIWGYNTETDPRTVDVHIKRLREKYWDCGDFEIMTVRGLGYKAEVLA